MEIRTFWKEKLPGLEWVMILFAIALAIPRFYWMLTNQYSKAIVIFVVLALLPFLFLTRLGRKQMGFTRPSLYWILIAFLLGAILSLLIYYLGWVLYDQSTGNWYVVVRNSINKGNVIEQMRPSILLFFLFSIPPMMFSPIGEEFFFRGILHDSIAHRWGQRVAMLLESAFFGITHLAHYGIILTASGLTVLSSAWIWVLLMMLTSVIFYTMKKKSGSIWGAVACHAGFNFAMMACIFYLIR